LKGGDPFTTIATPAGLAPELEVELEQIYLFDGEYLTLAEMLTAAGYSSRAISDEDIASHLMKEMQGTAVERDRSDNNDKLQSALKSNWRRTWRVKFRNSVGHIGGWTDWKFGKLNADGSVSDVAVDCPTVEFLSVVDDDGAGTYIGKPITVNHDSPSKLTATWEIEKESMIIHLSQPKDMDDGSFFIPGELVDVVGNGTQLRLDKLAVSSIDDGTGQGHPLAGYEIIESQDRTKAQFNPDFEITIYAVATKRMPNNFNRWWHEDVDAYPAAEAYVPYQDLPPSETVIAYRDYVDPANGKNSLGDGLGALLNQPQVRLEAERRAEVWKLVHGNPIEGEGVAMGVAAFRELDLSGPIKEISLEIVGHKVTTRVVVGNLANERARLITAEKKVRQRGYEEKGKKVA
jgi:hypothetical protein